MMMLLLTVKDKKTGDSVTIFGVDHETDEDTKFLIYRNEKWIWVPADEFVPID